MKRLPFHAVLIVAALALLLSACGKTKVTGSSVGKTYEGGYLTSILVVDSSRLIDQKSAFEDVFVKKFEEHGTDAVSYLARAPKEGISRNGIREAAQREKVQAVCTIRFVKTDWKVKDVPEPEFPDVLDPAAHNYMLSLAIPPTPGYSVERERVTARITIYDAAMKKVIWKARTETMAPRSASDLARSLADAVMKNLQSINLIR